MRYFTLAIAMATMLGLGAAHAQQAAMKGHQPMAGEHRRPSAHSLLAAGDGAGADIQATRHAA
jgi:hypothetical protein